MRVSAAEKARVVAQIKQRLVLLQAWRENEIPWLVDERGKPIRDEAGELQLDYFPIDITDVANWTAERNCVHNREKIFSASLIGEDGEVEVVSASLQGLTTIARGSIYQPYRWFLRQAIDRELTLIAAKATAQLESSNKASIINALSEQLKFYKLLASTQESDVAAARKKLRSSEKELLDEKSLRARNEAELNRLLADARAQVATLTAAALKVSPLRKVSKE